MVLQQRNLGDSLFLCRYSLWGLHTDLITSLPTQETQPVVWTGAMGLAATNTVNVVPADAQEAVSSVSCWLFTVLSYNPQRHRKCTAPETFVWVSNGFLEPPSFSLILKNRVVKAELLWQKSREKQLTARPLGKSPSHFQALPVSVQRSQRFPCWQHGSFGHPRFLC